MALSVSFARYSELVENCKIFIPHLHLVI